MSVPHDGEITATILVLLDKARKQPAFSDPHFYVKELRLAVGSHLPLDKILQLVEPLAEVFGGIPRTAVVEVHKMSDERERKVIVLSAARPPNTVLPDHGGSAARGHVRTDSELAYLQLPDMIDLADVPAASQRPSVPAADVKKGVRIDEDAITEKTMSIVISRPTQIDHQAQAVGGGILRAQDVKVDVKAPDSLEQLRLDLGRPSKDWPSINPHLDTSAGSNQDETCEPLLTALGPGKDAQQASAAQARSVQSVKGHVHKPEPLQVGVGTARTPISPGLPTAGSDANSSNVDSDDSRDDVTSPLTAAGSSFSIDKPDTSGSDSDSDVLTPLSIDFVIEDPTETVPTTPAVRKAFSEVTIGSVRPDEVTTVIKAWLALRWTYIAVDLGVIFALAIGLHLVG